MKFDMKKVSFAAVASMGVMAVVTPPVRAKEPVLELHSVGLYEWPAEEKDERFMDAVRMMRDRLGDLGAELDMDPMQVEMMRLGWDLLTARSSMIIAPGEQGIDASFVFAPGNGNTEAMHQQLSALAMMGDMEFVDQGDGTAEAMGPAGPMSLGFDENRIWLTMGEASPSSLDVPADDLPDGSTALMTGRVDFNGLVELFAPGMGEELNAQADMMFGNPMGMFVGEDAVVLEFAVGMDAKRVHSVSRLIGAKAAMQLDGQDAALFHRSDFAAVPSDAVRVSAFQTNMRATIEAIREMMLESGDSSMEELNEALGVDLIDDLLVNLGERAIYYQSDTTGGGGLSSAILMLDLSDEDAMERSHAKLVDRLNELAEQEARGYARVERRRLGGVEVFSMNFPGLPIPFEPCWAISDGKLVLAASPVGIEAALAQMSPRVGRSIVQNTGFREAILSKLPSEGAAMINYTDAPRMVARGYGMTNLLTSAVANAARSPAHPDRVVGPLLPGFARFTDGVQLAGSVSWWEGEDLVTHAFGDRSLLVQLATGMGTLADLQGIMMPAVMAGVTLPAIAESRQRAMELQSATRLRSITQGIIVYASTHDGEAPASLQALIDEGILPPEILISPMGSAYDGGPDYTVRLTEEAVSSFDAQYIVGIDRAAYVNGEWEVFVSFADAHVEKVSLIRLEELLEMPQNKGAREALQLD